MGGTGMAYDTGNSAVMNNPATLGMMKEGTEEIGIGIRGLHPEVQSDYGAMSDHSSATAFYMPSLSYIRKDGDITWGQRCFHRAGWAPIMEMILRSFREDMTMQERKQC